MITISVLGSSGFIGRELFCCNQFSDSFHIDWFHSSDVNIEHSFKLDQYENLPFSDVILDFRGRADESNITQNSLESLTHDINEASQKCTFYIYISSANINIKASRSEEYTCYERRKIYAENYLLNSQHILNTAIVRIPPVFGLSTKPDTALDKVRRFISGSCNVQEFLNPNAFITAIHTHDLSSAITKIILNRFNNEFSATSTNTVFLLMESRFICLSDLDSIYARYSELRNLPLWSLQEQFSCMTCLNSEHIKNISDVKHINPGDFRFLARMLKSFTS